MNRIVRAVWTWIDVAMALLLTTMIVLVFTNVVMRYGFSSGLRASVELSRLGFVWVVMLGAAAALRRGEHLAITELANATLGPLLPTVRRLVWLVILVAVSMLVWGAFRQTTANWNNISQLTGLPSGLMYLSGVVAGVMMAAIAVVRIIDPSTELTATRDDEAHRS